MRFLIKRPPRAGAQGLAAHADKDTPPRATTKALGDTAEALALRHLEAAGLRLLTRNYRTPGRGGGEIDLVMQARDGTVVFVEVRARASESHGGALASIGAAKRARIVFAARHYLLHHASPPPCRFDVVTIGPAGVQWLVSAFDADGA